ncbi:FtsX-like permease family protein [Actinomyces dentalis]|uniref:FtsX-like permease family protein n=1 Tax=Actinomyces dentalis TaxID=272548 RepID=UPI0028E513E9|nr:FtsX-like permease family protein [Actinomyces dentalis]
MPSLLDARRTAAALIAVALSAALIAFAFIVSDSYTTQLTANARLSIKGADVVVTTADLHDDGEVLDDNLISQLEAVDDVASARGEHWDVLRLDLPEQLTRAVGATVVAQDVPALSEHTTLTAGRLPQADGEVAVNTRLAEQQGLGVGDTIRLTDHDRTVRTSSTVVGIVSPGADTTLDPSDVMVYATPKQLAAMGATTAYHCLYVDAKPGVSTGTLVSEVERVVHAVQPGASVMDADTAVAQRAVSSTSGGATMSTMLNLLAPVCALVSAIVITTTFTALVARQTRTTGLLRCIGASRRQIMGAVLRTAALTGLIGSVAGAGLGAVAGTVLIRSGVIEDLGADQLTITPASLAVTIVLGAAVTLIAVLRPARRASRISPLVAITGQTVGVNRTRKRRWAAVSGLVLILTGGVLLVSGMTGHNLYIVAGGAALIALGILAALPLLIVLIVSITGRVGAKGRYPLLHLAARNLVRNPGRSTATAATLLIGVMIGSTLFVGLFSFSSSFQSILNQASPTDITIFGVTPQTDSAALTSTIRSIDGVQGTVLVPILDLTQTVNGSTRQTDVVSIDTATIAPIVRSTEGLEDLDDNTLIVGEIYDIPDGAAVTLTGPAGSATLTARVREGWGAAITPAAAERLNGTAPANAMMWVRAKGEGPTQALESAVRQATRGQDLMVNDSAQGRDAFSDALNQIMLLTCLVMGAALIISLTGLANITDVSVLERTREIGVLRATGADRSQIRRLIITETILLAVIGGTLGIIAGTALGAAGSLAVLGNGGLEVAIPWLPLAGLLAIALLVGATASLRPARRAAAMMPITALAAD